MHRVSMNMAGVDVHDCDGLLSDGTPWQKMVLARVSRLNTVLRCALGIVGGAECARIAEQRVWMETLLTRMAHRLDALYNLGQVDAYVLTGAPAPALSANQAQEVRKV